MMVLLETIVRIDHDTDTTTLKWEFLLYIFIFPTVALIVDFSLNEKINRKERTFNLYSMTRKNGAPSDLRGVFDLYTTRSTV